MNFLKNFSIYNIQAIIFDFDGVFTNNKVYVDQNGNEIVECNRSDGLAFDLLRKFLKEKSLKIKLFILSTETNPVVLARAKKLKIECYQGVNNKLDFIKIKFPKKENSNNKIIYLGNDLNDYLAMKYCHYSISPSDSHEKILSISDHILSSKGGEGCIREFCEKIIKASGTDILSIL